MPGPSTSVKRIDSERRFDSLFDEHHVSVFRYCVRRLGAAEADDAAAEVFAIAWRRLDQVPPGEGALAWLLAVAYRVVGNQYRARGRRVRLANRLLSERQPPVEPESADLDLLLIHQALASLRAADRELLRLSTWDGLSNAEIATVIGAKPNAIDQRLFRARTRLRARLDELSKQVPHLDPRNAST